MAAEDSDLMQEDPSDVPGLSALRQWRRNATDASMAIGQTSTPSPADVTRAYTNTVPSSDDTAALKASAERTTGLMPQLRSWLNLQRDDSLVIEDPAKRGNIVVETVIVLGVSLGASAIWSILQILDLLTRPAPLGSQTVAINNSVTPDRPWLDLSNQLAYIVLTLVPVVLALYLLSTVRRPDVGAFRVMGLTKSFIGRDLVLGIAMAAGVGIPGLGLYAAARALGMNVTIAAGNLASNWWTIPVYILLAAMNGVLEEVVMIGYLFTRWTQRGLGPWKVIIISALIRGSYHLYQGFGGFIGNAIMGIIFGWIFMRTKRVLPLIVAHTILDIVSFIGYALLAPVWGWLK